jgi:VWFA-related protein
MRIRFLFWLSISMALAGWPAVCAAQAVDSKPALTIKTPAPKVVLTVTVRDKKGALVKGLKAAELTLAEDGRPQTIQSFTPFLSGAVLPFRLGLLVDTGRGFSGAMESERKAAGKFVDQMLPEKPGTAPDQAFLIHFDNEVELLEDFTASRDKLHRELDEMGPSHRAQEDARGPESSSDDRERSHSGRGGTQLYDAIFLASDELMKTQEGHKALIVFSDGADRDSKMSLSDAVDAAEKANVAVYAIYMKAEQERGGGIPGLGGGHHGGGGYPGGGGGYPGGGKSGGGKEPAIDGKKILEKIATRTGGRCFEAKKKDNLEEIYGQIAEELRGQYQLTYTPDQADKDGGFHKIALKANKDDWTVVTREGYFAPGGETK